MNAADASADPSQLSGSKTPDRANPKSVYVGNLLFEAKVKDLIEEFSRVGTVLSAKIIMDRRGMSKG